MSRELDKNNVDDTIKERGDNMDTQAIMNLISSVGFPIVAYILLYQGTSKQIEALSSQVQALKETVINNTDVMTELVRALNREGVTDGENTGK